MACLIIEILMLLTGLYVLIKGKFDLTDRFYLHGWRARVAGLLWIAPLPLAFLVSLVAGVLIGIGILPGSVAIYIPYVEPLLAVAAFIGSIIFAYAAE